MNKLELIKMLKNEHSLTNKDAAAVVELFFDSMSEALAKGVLFLCKGI
jgi:integration host factor subunit beta